MVDLLRNKAYLFELDISGKFKEVDVPADMADEVATAREALIEKIAEGSESLIENFRSGNAVDTELTEGLQAGILSRPSSRPLRCGYGQHRHHAGARFLSRLSSQPAAKTEVIGKDPKTTR